MLQARNFKTRKEMQDAHQKDYNNFPFYYAFGSREEIRRQLIERIGIDIDKPEDVAKITSNGCGGVFFKKDIPALKEMIARQKLEKKLFTEDFKHLVDIIENTMWDHEYGWTCDPEDTLEALSDYTDHPRFNEAWKKAEKKVFKGVEEISSSEEELGGVA